MVDVEEKLRINRDVKSMELFYKNVSHKYCYKKIKR